MILYRTWYHIPGIPLFDYQYFSYIHMVALPRASQTTPQKHVIQPHVENDECHHAHHNRTAEQGEGLPTSSLCCEPHRSSPSSTPASRISACSSQLCSSTAVCLLM